MSSKIILRPAIEDDIDLLRYWDSKPHVLASDPNDYWGWEEDLSKPQPFWREQLIAELDRDPIGFLQIIDPFHEDTHYWGNIDKNLLAIDIWIGEEENLGKGYGTEMMQLAFEKCFTNSEVKAILIDPLTSNKRAIKFYERLGFIFLKYQTFGSDECYVMKITKEQYESSSVKD